MNIGELKEMIWSIIDVHIGGIPVTEKIYIDISNNYLQEDELGFCETTDDFKSAFITFNELELNCMDDSEQIDVICHEIAHLICEDKEEFEEHDQLWQNVVVALGGMPNYY